MRNAPQKKRTNGEGGEKRESIISREARI